MAKQSDSARVSSTKVTSEERRIVSEQQTPQLAGVPILRFPADWTRTAREGIQDRRSRPDE